MEDKNYLDTGWSVEDVHDKRPELTLAECQEVLAALSDANDAYVGINWDTVEDTAERLFPEEEREFDYTEEERSELDARFEAELIEYKKNQPRELEIERDYDDDLIHVTFPDNFQVAIDRREENEIEIRVWKIGQDNPLNITTLHFGVCTKCGDTCESADIHTNGLCSSCQMDVRRDEERKAREAVEAARIKPAEIVKISGFLESFAKQNADVEYAIDEWHDLPDSNIDVHFCEDDDTGKLVAYAYRLRADKSLIGDTEVKVALSKGAAK